MQRLFQRPKVAYTALVVGLVLTFALSAVGNTGSGKHNDNSHLAWIGNVGWAGFLLCLLAVVVFTILLLARRLRGRRRTSLQR